MNSKLTVILSFISLLYADSAYTATAIDAKIDKSELPPKFYDTISLAVPGAEPSGIYHSEIDGMYKVIFGGVRILYISKDGNYVLNGNIMDVRNKKNIRNVTRDAQNKLRLHTLDTQFNESEMIVFEPKNYRHTITVFSDLECGYCKEMHSQIDGYMKHGIKVRYLMFPRAGHGSNSFNKSLSLYCTKDKNKAYTHLINGQKYSYDEQCYKKIMASDKNPVDKSYIFGSMIGVTGTPTIMIDDGSVLKGYYPPEKLGPALDDVKARLEQQQAKAKN